MMRIGLALVMMTGLSGLAGCGPGSEATAPRDAKAQGGSNITLSGSATFGVVRGPANMPVRP